MIDRHDDNNGNDEDNLIELDTYYKDVSALTNDDLAFLSNLVDFVSYTAQATILAMDMMFFQLLILL